jgi:hypothetical protein
MSQDVYLKRDWLNHIQSLLPDGFTVFDGDEFKKTGPVYDLYLTFSYSEYFPHSACFDGISLEYRFHQVEQIFATIFSNFSNNSELPFGNLNTFTTIHFGFGRNVLGDEAYFKMREEEVYDNQSFEMVRPIIQNLMNLAIDFENQHNTLSDIYSIVESKGSQYWKHYRQPAPGFRAIVRKVLGYNYSNDLISDINRQTQSGKTVLSSFHQEIKDYLDNM